MAQVLLAAALGTGCAVNPGKPAETVGVSVDFTSADGAIRPLHGVNNAPMRYNGEKQWEIAEAGIPFVRTHDTGGAWGGTHFVDVPNIFRDFDADENDPKNYDFAFTDAWLKTVVRAKAKVFYRLGVTIENHWRIKSYNIIPPKDAAKWARICEHIVRHYNEGWAKGHTYGIEYWEIWNEPENPPMWKGSREQFFELYRVAANHLKSCFPDIKVGGYGGCGFYAIDAEPGKADKFDQSFVDWFDAFLKYVTAPETKAPLDFYSWHVYASTTPEIVTRHAKYVRERLDAAGLAATESILDEWNRVGESWDEFEEMKTSVGAACVAEAFCRLQRAGVDKAMYYDALPSRVYCGVFNLGKHETRTTTYHAFRLWNRLYRLGTACASAAEGHANFAVMAAKDEKGGKAILLVNDTPEPRAANLALAGADDARFLLYRLDDANDALACEPADIARPLLLPPYGIAMLTTDRIGGRKSPVRKAATFAGQDRK